MRPSFKGRPTGVLKFSNKTYLISEIDPFDLETVQLEYRSRVTYAVNTDANYSLKHKVLCVKSFKNLI